MLRMACRRVSRTTVDADRKAWALYSECPIRCSAAKVYRPRPHSSTMNPICATVDQARRTLILMRVSITSPARIAVANPKAISRARAGIACSSRGAKRISTTPPRFTTPACSSADTGVGASITWISQPCTGSSATRSVTASTRHTALTCRLADMPSRPRCAHKAEREPLPTSLHANAAAPMSNTSASRSAMRFLWAASIANGRSG